MIRKLIILMIVCVLSGCSNTEKNQLEVSPKEQVKVESYIIPNSYYRFCGTTATEELETILKYNDGYCEDAKEVEQGLQLNLTNEQKNKIIEDNNAFVEELVKKFESVNNLYKCEVDNSYQKLTLYTDEKMSIDLQTRTLEGVTCVSAMNYMLENKTAEWSVLVEIINCHTNNQVASANVPKESTSFGPEEWEDSYKVSKKPLTERQKSILSKKGLSTNYEKLTLKQKKAIIAIEELLTYAEEKYNEVFFYGGYVEKNELEDEHLKAYLTSRERGWDSFTITRTKNGIEDDYVNVAIRDEFADYISDGIKQVCSISDVKVYATISSTTIEDVHQEIFNFDGNVVSNLMIFLDEEKISKNKLSKFNRDFENFMKEHDLYGIAQIILLEEGRYIYLTKYNYADYLSDEHYTSREIVHIQK